MAPRDSGCTDHIINDESLFDKCVALREPVNVYLGDNRIVKATKIDDVLSYFENFGKSNLIRMENVFLVKDMKSNLVSYSKITKRNKIVSKGNMTKIINSVGKVNAVAVKENGLYVMKSKLRSNESRTSFVSRINVANKNPNSMSKKEKWHRVLGHVNFGYLEILCRKQLLSGIPNKVESEFVKCRTRV